MLQKIINYFDKYIVGMEIFYFGIANVDVNLKIYL